LWRHHGERAGRRRAVPATRRLAAGSRARRRAVPLLYAGADGGPAPKRAEFSDRAGKQPARAASGRATRSKPATAAVRAHLTGTHLTGTRVTGAPELVARGDRLVVPAAFSG